MKKIVLIIPYFGKWPLWFDTYLISVAANPTIHWLCPTDCEIPKEHPENITFIPFTLKDMNVYVNEIVEANVLLSPRKFCDLKPGYGEIFHEHIKEYDFWGICDMDIVWGNIRKFITPEILNQYDIISSRKENISGHFTLFRNTSEINRLYKKLPDHKARFEVPEFKWTDEVVLSEYIRTSSSFKESGIRVFWSTILCNQERGRDSHQEYYLDRWKWGNGIVTNTKTEEEIMYLHFINWKRTMKYNKVKYEHQPNSFYISYNGMHYEKHNNLEKFLNHFKNLINGYHISEKKRILKKRLRKAVNRRVKF